MKLTAAQASLLRRFECAPKDHNYQPLGEAYEKSLRAVTEGGSRKLYRRLFCSKCGATKEVLQFNRDWS
jgi:hypothetical protein